MKDSPFNFGEIIRATFLERPNRFLVMCIINGIGVVEAHLPNPGRLWELLLPGVTLLLNEKTFKGQSRLLSRKTSYTVLAVQRNESPVFLHTHITNQVARYLIENKLIPPLKEAEIIRQEVVYRKSRFDFLLQENGEKHYLEVKSCTLFGNGVAMFPDAVTERGKRHLLELAEMRRNNMRTSVLFIAHYPHLRWFMPDFHTDYDFSVTMLKLRNDLMIIPVAVEWRPDLTIGNKVKVLTIPWDYLEQEIKDRGSYLLVMRIERDRSVKVGGLGTIAFKMGYYVYAGSAMKNLNARIKRHSRKRKALHWHIDFLTEIAERIISIPIRSSKRKECEIARSLSPVMLPGPHKFGSSDCDCTTHLFWSEKNPLNLKIFHEILQRFRMGHPEAGNYL